MRNLVVLKPKKGGRCLAPDPSEKTQLDILNSRVMKLQIYNGTSLKLEGNIDTPFSGLYSIMGIDKDCHVMSFYNSNGVKIIWWNLIETMQVKDQ